MPLLKWLIGDANRHDERALDAAANVDPFLADAIEGYRFMPEADHTADVTRLKARLRQKSERRRGAGFYLMRIAAVGMLLLGTWMVFQQFSGGEKSAAVADAAHAESAPTETLATVTDSTIGAGTTGIQEGEIASNEERQEKRFDAPKKSQRANAPQTGQTYSYDEQKTEMAVEETNALAGIAEAESEPVPPPANEDATAMKVTEAAPKKSEELSNVEPNANRKAKSSSPSAEPPSPINGFPKFAAYVAANLRHPETGIDPRPRHIVQVDFVVQADGRPTNFNAKGDSPQAYKDEAIRLLREGPRWKGTTGTTATYRFVFE